MFSDLSLELVYFTPAALGAWSSFNNPLNPSFGIQLRERTNAQSER